MWNLKTCWMGLIWCGLAGIIGMMICPSSSSGQMPVPFLSRTDSFHVETNNLEGFWGPGMSAVDVNGDGWDDLTFGQFHGGVQLWLNNQSGFDEHPLDLGIQGQCEVKGVVWGDVDNDGDQDLFLGCRGDVNRFFLNEGDLVLTDVSSTCGLNNLETSTWGGSWVDLNRDGQLDLLVANYTSPYGYTNELYLGQGDGTFVAQDIADWGMLPVDRASFQHHWIDFTGDDTLDLYVINDRFYKNETYQGVGDSLVWVPDSVGLNQGGDLMGEAWFDMDLDGELELYLSNSQPHGNKLMRRDSSGVFQNEAEELNLDLFRQSWSCSAGDWDCDGWEDLYVSTSNWTYYWVGVFQVIPVNNTAFRNVNGSWVSWEDQTPEVDVQSFTHAKLDWNRDGFLDLAVLTCDTLASMLEGVVNSNHWLNLTPTGTLSNLNGIGWIVHCYTTEADGGVVHRTRQLAAGESFMTQHARRLHFGLGDAEVVDSLHAVWPSGMEEWLYHVPVDQHLQWVEGATLLDTPGCTYVEACNYDVWATQDDGSCDLSCAVMCPDLSSACGEGTHWDSNVGQCLPDDVCLFDGDGDGEITIMDMLTILSMFGDSCP